MVDGIGLKLKSLISLKYLLCKNFIFLNGSIDFD